jgi:hypothetical protein
MDQLPNSTRQSRETELRPSEGILVMLNLNQFLATANVCKLTISYCSGNPTGVSFYLISVMR